MNNYYGVSKVRKLADIPNTDGFKFIGVDKSGDQHYCIVKRKDDGTHVMNSNTATFQELIGWLPDGNGGEV